MGESRQIRTMINGSGCPNCGASVRTDDGTEYECPECGETFDVADLFLP